MGYGLIEIKGNEEWWGWLWGSNKSQRVSGIHDGCEAGVWALSLVLDWIVRGQFLGLVGTLVTANGGGLYWSLVVVGTGWIIVRWNEGIRYDHVS